MYICDQIMMIGLIVTSVFGTALLIEMEIQRSYPFDKSNESLFKWGVYTGLVMMLSGGICKCTGPMN